MTRARLGTIHTHTKYSGCDFIPNLLNSNVHYISSVET